MKGPLYIYIYIMYMRQSWVLDWSSFTMYLFVSGLCDCYLDLAAGRRGALIGGLEERAAKTCVVRGAGCSSNTA